MYLRSTQTIEFNLPTLSKDDNTNYGITETDQTSTFLNFDGLLSLIINEDKSENLESIKDKFLKNQNLLFLKYNEVILCPKDFKICSIIYDNKLVLDY